jgi:hypothetical protein
MRVAINVVTRGHVQLHGGFILAEKQPLHLLHFLPARAAVNPAHAYMVPADLTGRNNAPQVVAIYAARKQKRATGFIANASGDGNNLAARDSAAVYIGLV